MYDNFYTKYEDAKIFINEVSAEDVIKMLEKEKHLTAEQYAYLSKAYVFAHDDKKALKYAKKSIKSDPQYAYGYIRVAFVYGRLGKAKECKKFAEIAENLGSDNWYNQIFLAVIYSYLDDKEKLEHYKTVLLENPVDSPAYYFNLIWLFYYLDEYEKASEYFDKAKDYKDRYRLYSVMTQIYGDLGDADNTFIYLEKCLAIKETQDLLEKQIMCYIYIEDYDMAEKLARKLYRKTDDKGFVLTKLAKCCQERKQYDKALRYLRFADYTTQSDWDINYMMAKIYEEKKDYYSAIDYYKKSLKNNPKDEDILLGLSFCYSKIKELKLADKYADEAIKVNEGSAYSYYRKGNILLEVERYEDAAEAFLKSVELAPDDLDYNQSLSYCYSQLGNIELSLAYANRAILIDSNSAYSYFRKAWAYEKMNKYSEAIAFYEKCIECDNSFVDAYANISYCYSKMNNIKKSILYANKALMVNKDYAYCHYRKAWGLHSLGKYDEAISDYIEAIDLDPSDVYYYLGITGVFLDKKENFSALEFANKAIMLDRNCGNAYYLKSVALSNIGRKLEAEKVYAKAVQLGLE